MSLPVEILYSTPCRCQTQLGCVLILVVDTTPQFDARWVVEGNVSRGGGGGVGVLDLGGSRV